MPLRTDLRLLQDLAAVAFLWSPFLCNPRLFVQNGLLVQSLDERPCTRRLVGIRRRASTTAPTRLPRLAPLHAMIRNVSQSVQGCPMSVLTVRFDAMRDRKNP